MMGAAFDEELEDELRVTVIATGFGGISNPVPGKEEPAKEDKPGIVPPGVGRWSAHSPGRERQG